MREERRRREEKKGSCFSFSARSVSVHIIVGVLGQHTLAYTTSNRLTKPPISFVLNPY